jgi:hypothetical protein
MVTTRQIGVLRAAFLSAALLLTAIPAVLADPQADRIAKEQHACAVILGLDPSVAGHDACVGSLDRSLSDAQQGNEARACAYVGLGGTDHCAAELRATLWDENLRDPGD